MKLLSWNVNFRPPCDRSGDRTAKIKSVGPDIVTLQEVKRDFADKWTARLRDIDLRHHYWSGKDAPYQCLIASRWEVREVTPDDIGWRSEAPYPELLGGGYCQAARQETDRGVHRAHPQRCQEWLEEDRHLSRPGGGASQGERLAAYSDRRLQRAAAVPKIGADRDVWRGSSQGRRNVHAPLA